MHLASSCFHAISIDHAKLPASCSVHTQRHVSHFVHIISHVSTHKLLLMHASFDEPHHVFACFCPSCDVQKWINITRVLLTCSQVFNHVCVSLCSSSGILAHLHITYVLYACSRFSTHAYVCFCGSFYVLACLNIAVLAHSLESKDARKVWEHRMWAERQMWH